MILFGDYVTLKETKIIQKLKIEPNNKKIIHIIFVKSFDIYFL